MQTATLYTKPTCPYCIAAKNLLNNKGVEYTDIVITTLSDDERTALAERTNHHRTVPQIFIGETFVGGFDNLNALNQSGELDKLLAN